MTKDELISKQQLEIEMLKAIASENHVIKKKLILHFVAIGQPMNDNRLMFNNDQLVWCKRALDLIEDFYTQE